MSLDPSVATLLRYREQALNAASLIAALATTTSRTISGLDALADRQDQQLDDLLHDFAFKARKYLEAAGRLLPHLSDRINRESIAGYPEQDMIPAGEAADDDLDVKLTTYSLAFLLGRIIHSEELRIQRAGPPMFESRYVVPQGSPWAFTVRSERDRGGPRHFVYIEFLLEDFLEADETIEPWLRGLLKAGAPE